MTSKLTNNNRFLPRHPDDSRFAWNACALWCGKRAVGKDSSPGRISKGCNFDGIRPRRVGESDSIPICCFIFGTTPGRIRGYYKDSPVLKPHLNLGYETWRISRNTGVFRLADETEHVCARF